MSESPEKDEAIVWLRDEFVTANVIIDFLLNYIVPGMIDGDKLIEVIERRRKNWMPVVKDRDFFSIEDIIQELQNVEFMKENKVKCPKCTEEVLVMEEEDIEMPPLEDYIDEIHGDANRKSNSSSCGGNEGSSYEEQTSLENIPIDTNENVDHEDCVSRIERIKTNKGFVAKEKVKGQMVNILKGLKVYDDIFFESELSRLAEFISILRAAGRNEELSGETFIFFNKQLKGSKREMIQLGVPIFQSAKEETSHLDPIPPILLHVIDQLCEWRLLPESKKPNSCIINFFDEGEYSNPYFKPPHLDNPISTLFLQETTMTFGRSLSGDQDGNFRGSFTLPIKKGSLVVMRGNSTDMARHVVCPSLNSRVCITFLRVRPTSDVLRRSPMLWNPESSFLQPLGHIPLTMSPTWGMSPQAPFVFVPPASMVMNPVWKTNCNNGTGVFLPWAASSKKYIKHLPPRIQRKRLQSLTLPPPDTQVENESQIPCNAGSPEQVFRLKSQRYEFDV